MPSGEGEVMRLLIRMVLTCAIGLATGIGCSETSGSAGSGGLGGSGGAAGASGSGGSPGFGGAGGTMEGLDPLQGIGLVELVADGFVFTEGPTWRSAEQTILFSDILTIRSIS